MLNSKKKIITIFILSILFIILFIFAIVLKNNSVDVLSKYGSRGNEVTQIQTKLKRWGYYTGTADRHLWK